MSKAVFVLSHDRARANAAAAIRVAPPGYRVTIEPPKRTLEQNALLWPLLTAVSKSVEWDRRKLTENEWKDVFTAALHEQECVPGINGGVVFLGRRSSKMNKREFSELLDLIMAFMAERGVEVPPHESPPTQH